MASIRSWTWGRRVARHLLRGSGAKTRCCNISCVRSSVSKSVWSEIGTPQSRCMASSVVIGNSSIELADSDENSGVCLINDRHKYQSWPSEEHAAFAFARLATPGHTTIGPDEFISVLKRMQLDYNLGDHELRRVFDSLDANGDGHLCIEEFKSARGEHPFTKTLVETLSGSCPLYSADQFPDINFDCRMSTAEYYKAPLEDGFFGENIEMRKKLDYTYHNNYTRERQFFQDALIKNNLLVGSGSEKPWYVMTCGPMVGRFVSLLRVYELIA